MTLTRMILKEVMDAIAVELMCTSEPYEANTNPRLVKSLVNFYSWPLNLMRVSFTV